MPTAVDLPALRRHAVARSLFTPTTLLKAVEKLGGFVQADPLRAPARAQDLTLRHRVKSYRAGDLERRYPRLPLQEDFFINYGFVTPALRALMHPRTARRVWDKARWKLADAVLAEVGRLGEAHPADVDAALDHGPVRNWFGGNSRLSTELLDGLHYRGHLDVVRRDSGTRVYALAPPWAPHPDPQAAMDAMADTLVQKYAPLLMAAMANWVGASAGAGAVQLSWHSFEGIVGTLLLPFIAGQALQRWTAPWVAAHKAWVRASDQGTILLVVYGAFSAATVEGLYRHLPPATLAALLAICALLLAIVMPLLTVLSRALGFSREDEIAIVFCGSKKTLASGVPMAQILFAGQAVGLLVLPLMVFHQLQLMVCASVARRYARGPQGGVLPAG